MKKIELVDLRRQYKTIKPEIDIAIQLVIDKTAFIKGEFAAKFEKEFADYLGVKNCIGVSNGTDSLFLVLVGLGFKAGDEAILPVNTFIATAEAVCRIGGIPVFIDNNPDTYNIDISQIEKRITQKTRAIIPVHLYGQPAEMDEILRLSRKYNIPVIEDCAQAHGAIYKNKKIGNFSDCASFSFYPGKNLGAFGDAGAIVTNNDELAVKLRMLADHGRLGKYEHLILGYNHRFDGIQAAVLSVKLKYIEKWNTRRREIARFYDTHIDTNKYVLPININSITPVYHLYVIRTKRANRDHILKTLDNNGIATGVHYPLPLHIQPVFSYLKHDKNDFPVAQEFSKKIFSIPMHPDLTDNELDYICSILNSID